MKITLRLLLACLGACVHLGRPDERTHVYVSQPLNQQEAQQYCECHNGNLSSVRTPADQLHLTNLFGSWAWVGLRLGPQSWKWTDGSQATYFNWNSPREGCGAVTVNGLWVKRECHTPLPFLCQDPTGGYVLQQPSLVWAEALIHCEQLGMTLATFKSPGSSPGQWPSSPHWMGLQWQTTGWAWVGEVNAFGNLEDATYTNWQTRLYCALMEADGGWRDALCNELHWSVCAAEGEVHVLVQELLSWSGAQRNCQDNNMALVTVTDATENTLLRQTFVEALVFWIGLSNNPWKWTDGSSPEELNWANNEPNNVPGPTGDMEECVMMNAGALYDVPCSVPRPFFCQIKPIEPQLVSAPTSWEEALLHCRGMGGDLANVTGTDGQELVHRVAQGATTAHVWMGLRFLAGEWLWVCGGRLDYLNWGDPWGLETCPMHHCGAVERDTGLWVPRSCDEELDFLCQVPCSF